MLRFSYTLILFVFFTTASAITLDQFYKNSNIECNNVYTDTAGESSQSSEFIYNVAICQKEKDNELIWLNKSIQYSPVYEKSIESLYSFYIGVKDDSKQKVESDSSQKNFERFRIEFDESQKDVEKLKHALIKAYGNNSSWATLKLGELYLSGDYFEKNIEKGALYLKEYESKEKDRPKYIKLSMRPLMRNLWGKNSSNRSLGKCSELDKIIINNNWADNYALGKMYYDGDICVLTDYKKAYSYLYKFIKDISKKEEWLKKRSKESFFEVQRKDSLVGLEELLSTKHEQIHKSNYLIGNMYLNGYGVLKDRARAIEFYTRGAERHSKYDTYIDFIPSEIALAKIYSTGNTKKHNDLSLFWYKAAATHGSLESQLKLGEFFIEKNEFKQAKKWLQKAYLKGSETAKKLWVENDLSVK